MRRHLLSGGARFSLLSGWIGCKVSMFAKLGTTFDAYPFVGLSLILSMAAVLQAPVILMSKNRKRTATAWRPGSTMRST